MRVQEGYPATPDPVSRIFPSCGHAFWEEMTAMTELMSPFQGVTRRDFLKLCGSVAALIGMKGVTDLDVARALESTLGVRPSVVWTSFQACTGCAISLLQSRRPGVADLILRQISLDYQENVMAAAGDAAEALYEEVLSGDFYWVAEGSVATDPPEAMMIGGRMSTELAREAYEHAAATIAIGSCATYGNVQASNPNPTGAMGIADFLRSDGIADPVVINLSRCPGNGEDLVATLSYVLVTGELPELDSVGRPVFLYGQTIHDNCFRRGHFDAGRFVEDFGDEGWQNDWCLYKVGCKGPFTYAPCGNTQWNGGVSWCVRNGTCIGCAEPAFWDELTPFYTQSPGVELPGVGGVSAETIGVGLGIATAVGLGVHAAAQVATGRFGKGGPPEEEAQTGGDR
jgi:hydrogenase small subunit